MIVVCDDLNVTVPYSPRHLNTWFPVGDTVWGGLSDSIGVGNTTLRVGFEKALANFSSLFLHYA